MLDQVQGPRLVAMDTMNFWIQGERNQLEKTLSRVDLLFAASLNLEWWSRARRVAALAGHQCLLETAGRKA